MLHWDEKEPEGERQVDKSETYIYFCFCISASNRRIPGSHLKNFFLTLCLWVKVIQK